MAVDPNAAQWEQQAASGTGIPVSVTKAQAILESGESDTPISGAGAEGFWQFEPTTYNAYAAQAGVSPGTEFNPADETKVYIAYMNALLKQEGGSVFKALEAYNAGPGNLGAGAGYAQSILNSAHQSQNLTSGTPGNTSSTVPSNIATTGILSGIGDIFTAPFEGILGWISKSFFSALGVPSLKDLLQRLGLILLGVGLVFVGIRILSEGGKNNNGSGSPVQAQGSNKKSESESAESSVKQPSTKALSSTEPVSSTEDISAGEAMEAAAIA